MCFSLVIRSFNLDSFLVMIRAMIIGMPKKSISRAAVNVDPLSIWVRRSTQLHQAKTAEKISSMVWQ